jgi:hypothetical protein
VGSRAMVWSAMLQTSQCQPNLVHCRVSAMQHASTDQLDRDVRHDPASLPRFCGCRTSLLSDCLLHTCERIEDAPGLRRLEVADGLVVIFVPCSFPLITRLCSILVCAEVDMTTAAPTSEEVPVARSLVARAFLQSYLMLRLAGIHIGRFHWSRDKAGWET